MKLIANLGCERCARANHDNWIRGTHIAEDDRPPENFHAIQFTAAVALCLD